MHMHMNFWWDTNLGDFFISGFTINGATQMTILCISLFILSIVGEALKVHRARSRAKTARERHRTHSENAILLTNGRSQRQPLMAEVLSGIKEISIFAFHNILSYGLMLAVMMYNGYIFIAVALGAFIGYFLFGHISMKTNMENLQAIQTKIICSTRCAEAGESSSSGATVMQRVMQKSNSEDSSLSETSIVNEAPGCH